MASVNAKLRDVRLRIPTLADRDEMNRQADLEDNDRGAAILLTTLIENTLAYAIMRRLPGAAAHRAKLFDNSGILSTFDARIVMGEILGIFGHETRHNLDIIKHLRNTFAHAAVPITFGTTEIAEACHALRAPADTHGVTWEKPRAKFTAACYAIGMDLVDYAAACVSVAPHLAGDFGVTMVPVSPAPLP